jgi:hypothetical protein
MVNANHARPLAAFWLLAIAAGVVTAVGLRADTDGKADPPSPPSRVTSRGGPEFVPGGVLRADPTLPGPSAPVLSASPAGPPATPGAGGTDAEVAGPRAPGATHRVRPEGTGHTTRQPQATVTQVATSATGHPKGRHERDKAESTATATTTPPAHGKGNAPPGRGKGR